MWIAVQASLFRRMAASLRQLARLRLDSRCWLALLASASLCACAQAISPQSYGVRSLDVHGAKHVDEEAIKICLATQERPRTGFTLGADDEPRCGVPPFDASRIPISLWAWPWTDWPLYERPIFDRDLARIERWYQARGYYDARVTNVERAADEAARKIALDVTVQEGQPVLTEQVDVLGIEALSDRQKRRAQRAIALRIGEPFDEALYDATKHALTSQVREASYAKASVTGHVLVDPTRKRARVTLEVTLGPACHFGRVSVSGNGDLPARPVLGAADIKEGEPFSESALEDARRAIYALGPFASVELSEQARKTEPVVDLVIKVVSGRRFRFGVGAGIQSGSNGALTGMDLTGDAYANPSVWDAHLLAKLEHRNFLGGMRRLSIEDRPRLIFGEPFPNAPTPKLGNLLVVEFQQPAFIEPRTSLIATARWDRGPDPFGGGFMRSDAIAGLGPQRKFLDGTLTAASTLNVNLFIPDNARPYPAYQATYFQHALVLDLRDLPRSPRKGAYFAATLQHAGYFLPSDWDYVRFTPEARGYLPLPLGIVLAGRMRIGMMEVTHSNISVQPGADPDGYLARLRDLGPLRQRLRGGGYNSVRGYAPNTLGDITEVGSRLDSGGLRQWEASAELRVPITASFGTVLFIDAGDVSRQKTFRWSAPQTTLGIGLRYKTLVGPLRLDAGFAPGSLQTIGADPRTREVLDANGRTLGAFSESHLFGAGGAIHFTIGEAF